MPLSALSTSLIPDDANPLIPDDANPMGTDFVGGAEPLSSRPGAPSQVVPGSDFAGGPTPLTAEATEAHAA
jgi:hypothetical protein